MRFLGFLFIIALIVGAVGYIRGWFSVSTIKAGGKSEVHIGVDSDRVREDSKEAVTRLGELTAKAAATVKSLGRKVAPDESEIAGTVTRVDVPARDLIVAADSQTIELHVPAGVPIQRDGATVGLDQLLPAAPVKLVFRHAGDDRYLARIEIAH